MQIEWVFMGAAAFTAVVLFLVIRRTVRMCAKTIFAQAEEPTPQDVQKAQTPRTLPEGVSSLPGGTGYDLRLSRRQKEPVLLWMQAVNSRNPALLEGTGLQESYASLQEKQQMQETRTI